MSTDNENENSLTKTNSWLSLILSVLAIGAVFLNGVFYYVENAKSAAQLKLETVKSDAQLKLQYVRLAIGLIRPIKKADELSDAEESRATAIRGWAVDVLNKHSPDVPITPDTKKAIIEGKFDKGWDFDTYSYDGGYDYSGFDYGGGDYGYDNKFAPKTEPRPMTPPNPQPRIEERSAPK